MDYKISVIITTYNRGNMLENAIKSVMNQTYKQFEIIVVDDNANNLKEREKTKKIVKKYSDINLIENEKNLGGALSRNVGIEKSTGELISFLDDDDIYLPERLEKMLYVYNMHKNDNVGLIYCSCLTYDVSERITGEYVNNFEEKPIYNHMMDCVAGTSMWLAPKKVLIEVGMFEQSCCKQDSILLLKIMLAGYNIYCTKEKLVLYFQHGGIGISGLKLKNIEGIKKYREICRRNYNNYLTNYQIKNIENNFRYQIMKIYNYNKMNKEAKKELKIIATNGIFNKIYIKAVFKYYFPKISPSKIKIKNSYKSKKINDYIKNKDDYIYGIKD